MIGTIMPALDVRASRCECSPTNDPAPAIGSPKRTIWGMSLRELHDHYYAALGFQVVRLGLSNVQPSANGPFLLLEQRQLIMVDHLPTLRQLKSRSPGIVQISIHNSPRNDQHESVHTSDDGSTRRIHRVYSQTRTHCSTVYCTNDFDIAQHWSQIQDVNTAARKFRTMVSFHRFFETDQNGQVFDANDDEDAHAFTKQLLVRWGNPDVFDPRITRREPGIWVHESSMIAPNVRFIGPVWVGAGVTIDADPIVVGPHIIEDRIDTQKPLLRFGHARSAKPQRMNVPVPTPRRIFDIVFSIAAIIVTAPLWPIIALAIWIDDDWPILFRHRRQTLGGREFDCLKFRTMRRDAEAIKSQLQAQNVCDGPQFHLELDPRETRVGRVLRKLHLDELPQFLNVLAGQMSVVGPRPSPESENQYCPAWRKTRLSVKPGITGLWQVRRTRQPNADFQEWIRYDTEYVRRRNWWLDLRIIAATVRRMLPV